MKKAILILCLMSIYSVSLTGCFPKAKNNNTNIPKRNSETSISDYETDATNGDTPQTELNFTKHFEEELDTNLTVDADVVYPDISQINIQKAKVRYFNSDSYFENLNTQLIDIGTMVIYGNDIFDKVPYDYIIKTNNLESNDVELSDFSRNDAVNLAKSAIESLNISVSSDPVVVGYNKEYLNANLPESTIKGAVQDYEFTTEDEVYVIEFDLTVDSMPIYDERLSLAEYSESSFGSYAQVFVGRNGIVYAKISGVFDSFGEKTNVNIVPPEKAFEAIEKHYKNIIVSTPITIKEFNLAYIPVPNELVGKETLIARKEVEYTLTPSWIIELQEHFSFEEEGEMSEVIRTGYILINAVTGEEYK